MDASGPGLAAWAFLRARSSGAQAASFDGDFITGYHQYFPDIYRGYRWTAAGGYQDIGDLPGGPVSTVPSTISRDRATIVGQGNYSFSGGVVQSDAFVWTEETGIYALPGLGFGGNQAIGVSGNGRVVVGGSQGEAGFRPVKWTMEDSVAVVLADLPGGSDVGNAYSTSDDGPFITGLSHSSRFRGGAVEGLRRGGGRSGRPARRGGLGDQCADVSDDGSMVVGYSEAGAGKHGFIWDEAHGMRDAKVALQSYGLNLAGWTIARERDHARRDGARRRWAARIAVRGVGGGDPEPGYGDDLGAGDGGGGDAAAEVAGCAGSSKTRLESRATQENALDWPARGDWCRRGPVFGRDDAALQPVGMVRGIP